MLRVSLILAVCFVLAVGQEQTGEIVTSFDLVNGNLVQEDAGVFQACVTLDQSPSTNIDITVVAGAQVTFTEIDVNFGNPMPVLTFTPTSETRMCFEIPIIEDGIVQTQAQLFSLSLETSAQNINLAAPVFVIITETDTIQVSFESAEYTTDESMPVEVCAVVVSGRIAVGNAALTVMVTYMDDTVTAGLDYASIPLDFSFTSDTNRDCATISVIDDIIPEDTESLILELDNSSSPLVEVVQNTTTTVDITDNDRATIGFDLPSFTFSEGNFGEEMEVDVPIILSVANEVTLERPVFGRVISEDDTAIGGVDYVPVDQLFNFSSGSRNSDTYMVSVTIIGDNKMEPGERFRLVLSSQSDTVDPNSSTAVIEIQVDSDSNTCLMLRNITNGQVMTTGFNEGDTATYSCNEGFILNTLNAVRTCQISGSWTGEEPQCLGVCVGYNIMDGEIVYTRRVRNDTNVEGDLAVAQCNFGFEVSAGDEVRICQNDNTWSGTEQRCTFVNCGALTNIRNGMVTHQNTIFQSVAEYTCDTGFMLEGNMDRTCGSNGEWSGSEPRCSGARSVVSAGVLTLIAAAILVTLMCKQ